MSLAVRLKELRLKSGKSLQEVADEVSISKPHIWELERGTSKNPSFDLIKRLAGYYGVPVDALAGEDKMPDESQMHLRQFFREIEEKNLTADDIKILRATASALGNKNTDD
jgi:transcriptional regulator with XRE-family HTH domain